MPGPFYFAWVNAIETTFGPAHLREDELIYVARLSHAEGGFAALTLEVRNPRVGLLAPGRKRWAWFAFDAGGTAGVVPLFFGRVVGLPANLIGDVITLEFIAKPVDYDEQKAALAETLKVRPFYDPAFVAGDKRDDPDAVLEGYSALWHVDRVSHEVSISDVLAGEDGVQTFPQTRAYYDSVQVALGEPPLKSVNVKARMEWQQTHSGTAPIVIPSKDFETWTGESFISAWPKPGASLGGGWVVRASAAADLYGAALASSKTYSYSYTNRARKHANGDTLSISASLTIPGATHGTSFLLSEFAQSGVLDPFGDPPINIPMETRTTSTTIALWRVAASLSIALDEQETRKRKEEIGFTLTSDLQAIVTDAEDGDTETIDLNGSLDAIDVSRSNYFPSDRGQWSIEYLLCLARTRLRARARAVKVPWECRFDQAIVLSCRKSARLFDPRLPGGEAVGKIIEYGFEVNGDTGTLIGRVTIGCAIGYGDFSIINPSDGTPVYIEPGVLDGIQQYVDATLLLASEDLGYTPPLQDPEVPRFPNLTYDDVVLVDALHGSASLQAAFAQAHYHGPKVGRFTAEEQDDQNNTFIEALTRAMADISPWYELVLKPVAAFDYENEYVVDVTRLVVPKLIDLEAPSS